MEVLHHATLQFLISVLLNKTEEVEWTSRKGLHSEKDFCGPFELANIMTPWEYQYFWKDLGRLKLLESVLDCEIFVDNKGKEYISDINPKRDKSALALSAHLSQYKLAELQEWGLPTVIVRSKSQCRRALAKYVRYFQEEKLSHIGMNIYSLQQHEKIALDQFAKDIQKYGPVFESPLSKDPAFRTLEYYLLLQNLKFIKIQDITIMCKKVGKQSISIPTFKIEVLEALQEKIEKEKQERYKRNISDPTINWRGRIQWPPHWVTNTKTAQAAYKGQVFCFKSSWEKQKLLLNELIDKQGKLSLTEVYKLFGMTSNAKDNNKRIRDYCREIRKKIEEVCNSAKRPIPITFEIKVNNGSVRIEED